MIALQRETPNGGDLELAQNEFTPVNISLALRFSVKISAFVTSRSICGALTQREAERLIACCEAHDETPGKTLIEY
ncbi:hypothetical protein [Tardiphaga sp. 813_E8_N1_3]|uniref:hypothetical protein n=1 Tax=Tardiphaga sp. 813_E8_N1_3 TaxID=3240760 RepID=UPI003F271FA6